MASGTIRKESWKGRAYWVVRNEKGSFVTFTRQKGSGLRTKAQAIERFKKQDTLRDATVLVRGAKGRKRAVDTRGVTIFGRKKIGRNTELIRSDRPVKADTRQIVAKVSWGKITTYGYSNKFSSNYRATQAREDAFRRARSDAINQGVIGYDWHIEWISNTQGIATHPNRKQAVLFTAEFQYFSFQKLNPITL